jgi:hypothetical protein
MSNYIVLCAGQTVAINVQLFEILTEVIKAWQVSHDVRITALYKLLTHV